MATIQVILTNGTTADANEVMDNFDEIYSNIDQTNVASANKTGTGRFVLQTSPTITAPVFSGTATGTYTLAGTPTITSPAISGPTLSGTVIGTYNIGGTPTFTVTPTFSEGLTVATTKKVSLNVGATSFITENASNSLQAVVGGDTFLTAASNFVTIGTQFGLALPTGRELNLPAIDPPTANFANRNSIVKAWGQFNASGTLISGYNIAGNATHGATGVYDVDWNTNFSSSNYVVICTAEEQRVVANVVSKNSGSATINLTVNATTLEDSVFYIMAIGTQ